MNQPSYCAKFQTVANYVMQYDTVVFRGEAVLLMPEATRPETLIVDEEKTNHHLMDVKRPGSRKKRTVDRNNAVAGSATALMAWNRNRLEGVS